MATAESSKAPSTGQEFVKAKTPVPTSDQARATLAAALAEAQKPQHDCAKATGGTAQTGFHFAQLDATYVKANEPGFVALARCAEHEHAYRFMQNLSLTLMASDPAGGHPELLARALLGQGKNDAALALLKKEVKSRPKDANLVLTAAKAACKVEDFPDCLTLANASLKLVMPAMDQDKKEVAWRAQKYRGRSLLRAGKFDEASAAADAAERLGAPAAQLDEIKKEVVTARAAKGLADIELSTEIPLGVYHLFGKVKTLDPVLHVKVYDLDTKDHVYKVEAEIAGTTEKVSQSVTVLKGKNETVDLNPPLKSSFNVNSIRADTPAQLVLHIAPTDGGGAPVRDETIPVTLMPRDTLTLERFMDRDRSVVVRTPMVIGAWVTPNAKGIDSFLAAAKARLPAGQSFSGGQSATLPQVQAIYDELHARGMSYVMDPGLFVDGEMAQRTRLPTQVLESTNAQCIEGAILYATLMEAIGLRPIVTWVPAHSFSGWVAEGHDKIPPGGPPTGGIFFLETTMTHGAPFQGALDRGMQEANVQHFKEFQDGRSLAIDIKALREAGVTPQPWDL
jgi:hypothetical protein